MLINNYMNFANNFGIKALIFFIEKKKAAYIYRQNNEIRTAANASQSSIRQIICQNQQNYHQSSQNAFINNKNKKIMNINIEFHPFQKTKGSYISIQIQANATEPIFSDDSYSLVRILNPVFIDQGYYIFVRSNLLTMGGQASVETFNQELKGTKTHGFTGVYRKKGIANLRGTPDEGINSLKEMLENTLKKYADKPGIGEVIVTPGQDSEGKDVEIRSVKEHSYREIYDTSLNLGKALVHRRLFFEEPIKRMKMIGIYSKNRFQWFITDWACIHFGLTTVPLYDTLGIENLSYCLKQTEMTTLFVNSTTVKVLLELKDHGNLRNIISYDRLDGQTAKKMKAMNFDLTYYEDLITEGSSLKISNEAVKSKAQDCYTFSYTSGTTGPPKGAMVSHRNVLAFIAGLHFHTDLKFCTEDIYISYLPLPHIMERTIAMSMAYEGAFLVASSGNVLKLKDDCAVVKPTILVSVPRIFNRIVEGTKAKFAAESGIKRCIIDWGIDSKLKTAREDGGYTSGFYDSVVFSKVREGFGGRIRILASGSAPINPEVHAYMKAIMCCPLIEGYGQTESTAGVLLSSGHDKNYGVMAEISEGAELKLCDIPEMHYTSEDKDEHGNPSPRGEIWVRGPQIFLGYYKQEDVTRDTISHDGWLKSGDVGQIMPGTLSFKIIDRKKNIFKLQQGEYVAPDKVQGAYLKCGLISEIFLHGESTHNFAVAIATPNKETLLKFAETKGINQNFETLCRNRQIRQLLLIELNNYGKKEGLYGFEQAKNIFLDAEGFGPKGILTNTMKLMRFQARKVYKGKIDELYQEGELPLKL